MRTYTRAFCALALAVAAAGRPDESYLIHKLEGGPNILGVRMPFSGPPFLTSGQIAIIRRWIELGALAN